MRVRISYDAANDIIFADIINYTISLQSMPINSNDSSGSVGSFTVEFLIPLDLNNHLQSRGFQILEGKAVHFDSDYGHMYGVINSASLADGHTLNIQCTSYAGGLNAYNVQAMPVWRGENLVTNPSWENGTGGWRTGNTTSYSRTTSYPQMWADLGGRDGEYIAEFRSAGDAPHFYLATEPANYIPVTPGQWIAFSGLIATDSGIEVQWRAQFMDSSGTVVATVESDQGWVNARYYEGARLTGAAQVPSGATHVRLLPWGRAAGGVGVPPAGSRIWVDSVSLITGPTEQFVRGVGTLGGALAYYFSLGSESVNVVVDPSIANRTVVYPGWHGELWYHLKLLCAAENINFVLTGEGYVYVEPNRVNEVSARFQTSTSQTVDSSNLAQSVSVREYNCQPVTSALFYPRGGWSEEVPVLSVNAGEYTEQTIELAGSMETFQEPVMQTFVSRDHAHSSVYTIVAEDGFPIQPARWDANGGKIEFEIDPDYQTMTVKMQGAEGLFLDNGDPATSFSLALSSATGGGTYSTLRIVGAGVLHENEKEFVVATGIPESVTGTEVGATIDNPFLFDRERVGRAASFAAASFAGAVQTASGSATYLGSGFGVDDVGGRITLSGRPFRIRDVNYTPDSLTFSAEDDLLHSEVQLKLEDMTYGDVEQENSGLTYRNVTSRGLQYE